MHTKKIYILGACLWLVADFLSDEEIRKNLRTTKFRKIYNRILESKNEYKVLGDAALTFSAVGASADRYTRDMIKGHGIGEVAEAEAVEQFAGSAEYLESWLYTNFLFESEEKKIQLSGLINKAVAIVAGRQKDDLTIALEWLQMQKGTVSIETVRNKLIQIKHG